MKKIPKKKDRPDVDRYGRNELINYVIENDLDKVKKLVNNGFDVNSKDDNLWTPLHFAAQSFNENIVAFLLNNNADPNAKDSDGNTPIFRALFSCHGEDTNIFTMLLEKKGDPQLKNNNGISAIELAGKVTNFDLKKYFPKYFKVL